MGDLPASLQAARTAAMGQRYPDSEPVSRAPRYYRDRGMTQTPPREFFPLAVTRGLEGVRRYPERLEPGPVPSVFARRNAPLGAPLAANRQRGARELSAQMEMPVPAALPMMSDLRQARAQGSLNAFNPERWLDRVSLADALAGPDVSDAPPPSETDVMAFTTGGRPIQSLEPASAPQGMGGPFASWKRRR